MLDQLICFWNRDYIVSGTQIIPDISFGVNQCEKFNYNTEASYEISVKMVCCYLQVAKDKILVFNPSKILVVDFYAGADFVGLWRHGSPQDHICVKIRILLVVKFSNFPILTSSRFWRSIFGTNPIFLILALLWYHYRRTYWWKPI